MMMKAKSLMLGATFIAVLLFGRIGLAQMDFGGMERDSSKSAEERMQAVQEQIGEKVEEQKRLREEHFKGVEKVIERHVQEQRTSKELKKGESSLFVELLEFHDADGDGVVDHPADPSRSSALERAFDPRKNKKLKIYQYIESYKGFKLDDLTVRHLRRKMEAEKRKEAEKIGKEYAGKVLETVTDEKGHLVIDLAEDALRDIDEKLKHHAEEAMQFQRIKRLEKVLEMRGHRKARLKGAYRVKAEAGYEEAAAIVGNPRLDARKKSDARFQAITAYTSEEDKRRNLHAFHVLLEEYKRTHPKCLKPDWNCYVDKKGKIVEQHITDSYQAAEQVMDAQEYEAQSQLLYGERGEAFEKRLPGELENLSAEQQAAIRKAREREKRRMAVIKKIIEKKKKYALDQKGRVISSEVETGKIATEEEIRRQSKASAFKDARQGRIDIEELKKEKGKAGFKTLDY